ncbi:zinc ribbon domain-containing protein [Halomicroarcula sp. F13]|uniref:Zinc ribbon domain-containing protein n=1 Tax=Haloarcula rubra TaxID=2487747 RepID=A0AAW4PMK4_9EURY|nr:zinc ribbon domain-containing protein [Halomicroarcula rubra]MBX0322375.1 zinc ribbon domain-containing protein [Halomicroarcula rubra]
MVTPGEVYVLLVTAMALVALAVAIPVLLRIVVDGRARLGEEPPAHPDEGANPGAGGQSVDPDRPRCPHCGTENDADFVYCRECLEQL